jgi:hypothetical protein
LKNIISFKFEENNIKSCKTYLRWVEGRNKHNKGASFNNGHDSDNWWALCGEGQVDPSLISLHPLECSSQVIGELYVGKSKLIHH